MASVNWLALVQCFCHLCMCRRYTKTPKSDAHYNCSHSTEIYLFMKGQKPQSICTQPSSHKRTPKTIQASKVFVSMIHHPHAMASSRCDANIDYRVSYFDNAMTKFMINNRTRRMKNLRQFVFYDSNCQIVRSRSLMQRINYD